ncbi:MAG: hypothetical protein UW76_C0031G0001, partial [Parcubacteria group bacterium GW2011_GWF2_44_8b]
NVFNSANAIIRFGKLFLELVNNVTDKIKGMIKEEVNKVSLK